MFSGEHNWNITDDYRHGGGGTSAAVVNQRGPPDEAGEQPPRTGKKTEPFFKGIPALNGAAVDIRMEREREERNAATMEYVIKRRIQWAAYEKAKAEERARIGPHPMPYDERELRDERDAELLGKKLGRHTPQGRPLEHWE